MVAKEERKLHAEREFLLIMDHLDPSWDNTKKGHNSCATTASMTISKTPSDGFQVRTIEKGV